MVDLRSQGGIARDRRNTAQRSSQGSETAQPRACRARAVLDGENGVVRYREQQGRPTTLNSTQVLNEGTDTFLLFGKA